jgi:hydrogenase maturation protease
MNAPLLEKIVNAVLYEGYILYPYRASSKKNMRERFTFGRVYPEAYSAAQNGLEPCVMQTECLVETGDDAARLNISVRFLHPMAREMGLLPGLPENWNTTVEPQFQVVPELRVDGELHQTWMEAVEREIKIPTLKLDGNSSPQKFPFHFPASKTVQPVRNHENQIAGVLARRQDSLEGIVEISIKLIQPRVFKIASRILNRTPMDATELDDAEKVSMRTFASAHTILSIESGEFISLMDPPPEFRDLARACKNICAWPVLVGDEEKRERDTMLSSPIILYDYPKIAPESAGTLFDGTEIDEILTLRILTMTDDEKIEMRRVDEQARRLLERTENLPGDSLLRMHGTMRKTQTGETPAAPIEFDDFFGANTKLKGVNVGGIFLQAGDRVRVRPKTRADILDMALDGKMAIVEAVEQDLERKIHLAVIFENDPGKDLGLMRQPGHRFFYGVDEVEPLRAEESQMTGGAT